MADSILFAVQAYPDGGGISSILENYVAELQGSFEVHVAVVEDRPGRAERLRLPSERVHVLGYSNRINPLLLPTSVAFTVRVGRWLRGLVQSLGPGALVVQDALNLGAAGVVATRGSATRLVVMDHGTLTNVYDRRWLPMVTERLGGVRGALFKIGFLLDTPWRAARWRLAVGQADQLWYTGEELRPWFSRAGERAHTYAQTVPTDFVPATSEERHAARTRLGLADDIRVMNMVGRLDGEKGLDTILDAVEAVGSSGGGWTVLLVGDGSLEPWVHAEVARRGLSPIIRLLGRLGRSEVREIQQVSDFHLYAGTISCGVSICLLEAMASGVVPIVSDVPIAQRHLVEGVGWVFPAGDAAELASALREVLTLGPGERADLAKATVERVHSASDQTVPELLEVLLR